MGSLLRKDNSSFRNDDHFRWLDYRVDSRQKRRQRRQYLEEKIVLGRCAMKRNHSPTTLPQLCNPVNTQLPLFPASLCGKEARGNWGGCSRPFLASAPALLPGQRENGFNRPTTVDMIQNTLPSPFDGGGLGWG
jgi:hypothetical protein